MIRAKPDHPYVFLGEILIFLVVFPGLVRSLPAAALVSN